MDFKFLSILNDTSLPVSNILPKLPAIIDWMKDCRWTYGNILNFEATVNGIDIRIHPIMVRNKDGSSLTLAITEKRGDE